MHQNVLSVKAKKLDLLVIGDFRQKRRACFWKGEQLLVLQICTCNICFLLSIWRDKAVPLVFTNLAMSNMWWGLRQAWRVLPPPLRACPWCGNPSSHDFLFQIRSQTYFLCLHASSSPCCSVGRGKPETDQLAEVRVSICSHSMFSFLK